MKIRTKSDSFMGREEFFGSQVNLASSGQFHTEAFACSLSDVYSGFELIAGKDVPADSCANEAVAELYVFLFLVGSSTHLSEFWMVEAEISFADLNDCIDLAQEDLKHGVRFAFDVCADDLLFLACYPGVRRDFEKGCCG